MPQVTNTSILVVEDEPEIRKFLGAILVNHSFNPTFAETAHEGIKFINLHTPEIVILDLGLPDMDGLELIKNVRQWTNVPIIVLSARGRERDKVAALEFGADDYLTKPFGAGELLARLKVMQRHNRNAISGQSALFTNGDLRVDLDKREVHIGNRAIDLTPTEYKLLCALARQVGKVVTYQQLLREVWGKNAEENNHYLRVYTQHLRRKLADDPLSPKYIITEAGIGYRMKAIGGG
jgi:two-component system KDP operon response regulator KdpE